MFTHWAKKKVLHIVSLSDLIAARVERTKERKKEIIKKEKKRKSRRMITYFRSI